MLAGLAAAAGARAPVIVYGGIEVGAVVTRHADTEIDITIKLLLAVDALRLQL